MSQQFQQYPPAPQAHKKPHTLRTVLIVLAAAFCVMTAGIVSCVAVVGTAMDETTDSPVSASGATETPDTGPAPEPVTTPTNQYTPTETVPPEEPAKDTTTVGKTLTYESGLAVRVVSAKVFTPSYASGLAAGHKAVKVTWTVTNGTDANFDLSGAEARLTYGADGVQAESVYAEGVDGQYPFDGSVRPGQKKTATSAFSVPKGALSSIVVEVEPDFNSETAFFTGAAK
jgi:hypothetical protein